MNKTIYYGERSGNLPNNKYNFSELKRLFVHIYNKLSDKQYFQEAFGYHCTDGDQIGKLGSDISSEILLKTGYKTLWPVNEKIVYYNEIELFTFIEFLFQNVSKPIERWYHDWNNCGYHATKFDAKKGRLDFLNEINELLSNYYLNYYLTDAGEIQNRAPEAYQDLLIQLPSTDEPKSIDDRIEYAISRYFRFDSGMNEKKDAVRTLGDILEYYRKQNIKLAKADDSDLFKIINGYDLRHHNKMQQGDYDKEVWYEWMFYGFLSSIRLIKKLNEKI